MKNNNDHQYQIRKARSTQLRRANTDILLNPVVVQLNANKLGTRPKKRKINYEKKILNDPFVFNV